MDVDVARAGRDAGGLAHEPAGVGVRREHLARPAGSTKDTAFGGSVASQVAGIEAQEGDDGLARRPVMAVGGRSAAGDGHGETSGIR
ncbi:hypothetical protein [Paludisphaera mucosa]|uniref:Uncharacterized protein n=1 Tax=Paludisphaera mucosa TaxID=3030827 RepID=A0ABT6F9P9_9BACT|nr:hypothetical protein [Paludisphaera mucosa]MDG3004289.1 hypothetical protein [Paludisphaera mucosa]